MRDQGQHRISQVYLKHFGFKNKNGHWNISVYEIGNPITSNKFIKSFTRETNVFDVTLFDEEAPEVRRYFENNSNLIEDYYASVIRKIEKNGDLDEMSESILIHYVSNILCRTKKFRSFLEFLIQPPTRGRFFDELLMFSERKEDKEFLEAINPLFPINEQINLMIGNVMNHLVRAFETFNLVIIKDFDDRGWFTTDNPVTLDIGEDYGWIVPPKAEVYFPLSRRYCLFMYNPSVLGENELRNIENGRVIDSSDKMHEFITIKITSSATDYLVYPFEIGKVDLRTITFD
jgi:hypothetical protein